MGFIIGQPIPISYYHGASGVTINARVIDEADGVFGAELTLTENAAMLAAGRAGWYESTFTPDAAGHWKVAIYYAGVLYGQIFYYVGGGLTLQEQADVEAEAVDALESLGWDAALATILDNFSALRIGYLDELDFDLQGYLDAIDILIDAIIADIGVFPTANYATLAAFVEDNRTRLIAILAAIAALPDAATIEAECVDALESFVLDTLIAVAGPGVPVTDSFLDFIMNVDGGQTFDRTTDSLEALGTALAGAGGLSAVGAGVQQTKAFSITDPLNNGVTTVCTVGSQPVVIDSIVLHADTAAHADMTTCAIEGGLGQVVTFIPDTLAIEANLDAADKQVSWTGAVRLAVGKIIYIDLQGVGANAADLTVTVTYHAEVNGGVLA